MIQASEVPLPEGCVLRGEPEILVVNVVAAPTEAQLEADWTPRVPASSRTSRSPRPTPTRRPPGTRTADP